MSDWLDNPLFVIAGLSGLVGIGVWVGKINEHKASGSSFMSDIKSEIAQLRSDVKELSTQLGNHTIKNASPLLLTDLGQDISRKLAAPSWAEKQAEELFEQVKGKTKYDIQEFAFEYVREKYTPDEVLETSIKLSAFEKGLRKEQVLNVLAIELRDRLISLNEETVT